ncbi:hypothetical protein BDR22DRAFT_817868 [Usnea florida]
MPPKWSRQEEVKKLKDRMTEIQEESSRIGKLSKKREDALHAAVPGIHPQQQNDVLQSAADWCKFYDDDTAWLQQKARLEAQHLLDTNEALHKIEHQNATLRVQLDDLKVVKKEPGVESSEWPVIYEIRDLMLQHPKMVQAFFDHGFIGKLEELFKTKWDNFDERIDALERSVYGAIHVAGEEVKEFLETDFIPRLGQTMQELRTGHTVTIDRNKELETRYDEVKVRLDEREKELAESQAEHQSALRRVRELESRCALVDSLYEGSKEELVESQAEHAKALNTIKELESQCAHDKVLFKKHADELVNDLDTKLAEEKDKLRSVEERATRYSSEIAGLETKVDKEKKKLEKAMLQHQKMDAQYSLLTKLNLTKTRRILSRPIEELEAIVTRAVGFTQSTSNIEAARILDSNNTDLPEGTQLIADVSPDVFILIVSGEVEIFDKADIERVEYDIWLRMRLVMDGKSLLICDSPMNDEKSGICESWMIRHGVERSIVEAV